MIFGLLPIIGHAYVPSVLLKQFDDSDCTQRYSLIRRAKQYIEIAYIGEGIARAVAKTDKVEPDERSEELKKYGDCRPDLSVNEPNFKAPTDIAWVMRLAWEALSVAAMVSGGGGQGSKILRSARRPGSWSGHSHLLNAINEATINIHPSSMRFFPYASLDTRDLYVAYCIQH